MVSGLNLGLRWLRQLLCSHTATSEFLKDDPGSVIHVWRCDVCNKTTASWDIDREFMAAEFERLYGDDAFRAAKEKHG